MSDKQSSCEKGCSPSKCQGKERCEIKGGGQEMAAIIAIKCGKSMVTALIERFYGPSSGVVSATSQ